MAGWPVIAKNKPFRSKKLRWFAGGIDVACVSCGSKGNVCLAHRNLAGEFGMGMKGPDWWGAILCNSPNHLHSHGCHGYGDGPGRADAAWWELMIFRTLRLYIARGYMMIV